MFQHYAVSVAAVVVVSCAGQVPPAGGPPDTTPPTIIRTVPDTNAIHVRQNSIVLEFSEYVDRRSVEESIFISPYVGDLDFDWGATEVKVTFSEQLKKNTTYVVNVGTDVVDLRAHNRMAEGYTLAFSTGDSIDQGVVSGRVFDEKPEGVMIFAYALAAYDADTLDPSKEKPDYIIQTGKNGLFTLSHIAFGRYRIIAIRDEYRNLLYDKQVDQFGVTVGDTAVTNARRLVSDLWFRLSQEDTSKPFLTSVEPLTNHHIRVRFSEPIDSLPFAKATFTIVDTLTRKPVEVILSSRNRVLPTLVNVLTKTSLDSGVQYRVTAQGIFDRAGNQIDSANASSVFTGTVTPDTVRATMFVRNVTDSAKGIELARVFEMDFSEPVLHLPLMNAITLRDSTRSAVRSSLRWLNAEAAELVPAAPLQSKAWYQIRVVMDSVRDYAGNRWKDSTWTIRFQSLDLRTTGTVEGIVVDNEKERGRGAIYVTTACIDFIPPKEKTIKLKGPSNFAFDQLPEGRYTLRGFRDADSSGGYSFGRPFPFVPSERFAVSSDTVKVRARWGVEGVVLKFK